MINLTTDTYAMKREILTLSNKFSRGMSKPRRKFVADMTYGMLASRSCLLSDVTDGLHENIKKKNTIKRLYKLYLILKLHFNGTQVCWGSLGLL